MSERVTMPALGESVTEGTVTRWLKSVGDEVAVDEPLLEVSTDKVDTEIPSPVAGRLAEILVQEDETVAVGADLAVIAGTGDAPHTAPAPTAASPAVNAGVLPPTEQAPPAPVAPVAAPDSGKPAGDGNEAGTSVAMPALGESVTEGTVTRWLKSVGDEVAVDEPLLEVSTDKVDTEIPSPVAGTLQAILVAEDETAQVGQALAVIGSPTNSLAVAAAAPLAPAATASEEPQPPVASPAESAPQPQSAPAAQAAPQPQGAAPDDLSSYTTPLVRKLAADHGIDLSTVTGSGVGGRIRKQDVLAAAASRTPAAPTAGQTGQAAQPVDVASDPALASTVPLTKRGTREPMSRLRKTIASRMVASLQTSAQLTTVVEVDMTKVERTRAKHKDDFAAREGTKLTVLPFVAQAAAEALKLHPIVNASVEGDEIVYHDSENLSIAVDTERGLLTPVVKGAGALNVAGLARAIADVAERTRTSKITPDDLSGGTFTITNTGSRGALFDTPILNQPQVAMLGTGSIVRRPVVVRDTDGQETIAIRSMMYLALSYDHRVVDGADAARFLGTVKARLEAGAFEV